ncbi:hypothetical protein NQ315_002710 [Exocentrus adspersus]|uniref:Uncharacterized protein n=1 Tax=Exocentrus adspersus TaxID=1586481 RepID=A0AAV8VI45_9CUCU|nr:hypothetical protein NQ315_002710 [Exocentrus adspersus]
MGSRARKIVEMCVDRAPPSEDIEEDIDDKIYSDVDDSDKDPDYTPDESPKKKFRRFFNLNDLCDEINQNTKKGSCRETEAFNNRTEIIVVPTSEAQRQCKNGQDFDDDSNHEKINKICKQLLKEIVDKVTKEVKGKRKKQKCYQKFNEAVREEIIKKFWNLNFAGRKLFLEAYIRQNKIKYRSQEAINSKKFSLQYLLPLNSNDNESKQQVCKPLFLHTLGLKTDELMQGSSSIGEGPYPGCRYLIRQAFRFKGTPEKALDTMEKSLNDNTIKQYNVTLKLWWDFCNKSNLSLFEPQISQVLTFLQELLETSNLLVKRFMKGIFKLRPPKPRYNCTWEPQQVLDILQKVDTSSLKQLSYKLAMLLALATDQRVKTLWLITCANIHFSETGVKIPVPDPIKTSKPHSVQPCLDLPYLKENPQLCVASTLKNYLDATASLRQSSDNLFITFKKPHRSASKQSISRWIKDTLRAKFIVVP